MESALIVSSSAKAVAAFTGLLNAAAITRVTAAATAAEARRLLPDRDVDLVIVDAPLSDEPAESLARHIVTQGLTQAILVIKGETPEAAAACAADGVLVITKPVNKTLFKTALTLVRSAQNRMRREHEENERLRQKIDEIRTVDRAKAILISRFNMSEQDAHRFIEKQAMNMRTSRKVIAEGILKTYDN